MEKVGLNITPKEFKQLSKWSENIYNTAVVIDYFVANQPEIEECYNLAPVVSRVQFFAPKLFIIKIADFIFIFKITPILFIKSVFNKFIK